MVYQPEKRGSHAVGVTTLTEEPDSVHNRPATIEVWYPATAGGKELDTFQPHSKIPILPQAAARDAEPVTGNGSLVLFSHGYGSHRRQSTYLCTHLASHGYVVCAPEHHGNTLTTFLGKDEVGIAPVPDEETVIHRPLDVARALTITKAWRGARGVCGGIGICGHSYGGWTSLAVARTNPDITAIGALASAGGIGSRWGKALFSKLKLPWEDEKPALFITCSQDSLVPESTTKQLFDSYNGDKSWVSITGADHFHFCDAGEFIHEWYRAMENNKHLPTMSKMAPIAELSPPKLAREVSQALFVALFDYRLRGLDEAKSYLENKEEALSKIGLDDATFA